MFRADSTKSECAIESIAHSDARDALLKSDEVSLYGIISIFLQTFTLFVLSIWRKVKLKGLKMDIFDLKFHRMVILMFSYGVKSRAGVPEHIKT